jgi:hypothetical protein
MKVSTSHRASMRSVLVSSVDDGELARGMAPADAQPAAEWGKGHNIDFQVQQILAGTSTVRLEHTI